MGKIDALPGGSFYAVHRSGLSFAFQLQLLFIVPSLGTNLPVSPVVGPRPPFNKGHSILKFMPTTAAFL